MFPFRIAFALCTAAIALSGCATAPQGLPADTIYVGGTIVTVNDAQPVAEAVAVRDGRIDAVGSRASLLRARRGPATQVVDLHGRTMIPGIVDPHSHFFNALSVARQANVAAPPVGPASTPEQIVAELRRFAASKRLPPGEMLIGYGYDENLMPAGRSLTRDDLDAAFPDTPVIVMHVSLHGAVLNSAAFRRFGISADTATPPGGIIARKPGSREPAGLVMETAFLPIYRQLPAPRPEDAAARVREAEALYAAAGITTAQEGATGAAQLELLERAAADGALYIDVIAYPFMTDLETILAKHPASDFGHYVNRLKLGGCKIVLDGSPQGRTAFFSTPYLTGGPDGEADWRGQPTMPQAAFDALLGKCYGLGLQVLVHANGDAAIDMVLAGHERVAAGSLERDRRTTVIHSQFVRRDQLERYARDRLLVSFFTSHAYFFSAAHLKNRGPEQTAFLSPMRTAIDLGLRPTDHTDFNVTPLDQMFVLWSAVTREARGGEVIGPSERVTPLEALKAITINAAYQSFEEGSKGSIEPGKLADLVILSANPLGVAPDAIKDIRVLETIKEGRTIYRATEGTARQTRSAADHQSRITRRDPTAYTP